MFSLQSFERRVDIMSHLVKVDHVTYACAKGMIEKWAWFHTEVEGGKLVTRIDDVDPTNPRSSMKLWCIDYGSFGIALVEGIDREEKSQVTLFAERHGDHSIQHVAYDTHNLDKFTQRLQEYGCHPLGEPISKRDSFGLLKQLFCRGYSQLSPAENSFAEYVQRPKSVQDELEVTFSQKAGKGFYRQIEEAMDQGMQTSFTSFTKMPSNWQPAIAEQPASAARIVEKAVDANLAISR
ncbi:MAG: VOC family protein [Leptolyngbyaceae cyanobacterium bins.349]|nr:VOC family protein [Leptolyngbyaceae cyanobacterium bins.349]